MRCWVVLLVLDLVDKIIRTGCQRRMVIQNEDRDSIMVVCQCVDLGPRICIRATEMILSRLLHMVYASPPRLVQARKI